MLRAQSSAKAASATTTRRLTEKSGQSCPPHYWIISHDPTGERWDCQSCATVKRPVQPRFVNWGERACTWSREERYLAGLEQSDPYAEWAAASS